MSGTVRPAARSAARTGAAMPGRRSAGGRQGSTSHAQSDQSRSRRGESARTILLADRLASCRTDLRPSLVQLHRSRHSHFNPNLLPLHIQKIIQNGEWLNAHSCGTWKSWGTTPCRMLDPSPVHCSAIPPHYINLGHSTLLQYCLLETFIAGRSLLLGRDSIADSND